MPNTQTSVPAFTAGQVLTAQQCTEINTGIPVFATTTTRDAAFGGTGEKVLAEGQFAYIEASDTTQFYNGSSWQNLGGLDLVTAQSFSAVGSVNVNNCFSSLYRNYKIIIQAVHSASATDLLFRLRVSGTDSSGSNYLNQKLVANLTSVTAASATATSLDFLPISTTAGYGTIEIGSPNLATSTYYNSQGGNATVTFVMTGRHDLSTAYDGFTILVGSGTITGTLRVYGYKD